MRDLFLTRRFFVVGGIAVLLFALSFGWEWLFVPAQVCWWGLLALTVGEIIQTFGRLVAPLEVERQVAGQMSLGDENAVILTIHNRSDRALSLTVIDELPPVFQERDFALLLRIAPRQRQQLRYVLRPPERGVHAFGDVLVLVRSRWGMIERRMRFGLVRQVSVYPSLIQMRRYELIASSRLAQAYGLRQLRRLGHSYEFEQIKNYVPGDDYRSINWKATGRQNALMVNQYQDERAQQVYLILDKSRLMQMPFDGMSLLDYAINAALVIANLALKKQDKAGLMTFADRMEDYLPAESRSGQIQKIYQCLYRQRTQFPEANYEALYQSIRSRVGQRSLLLLFTNHESRSSLERNLPLLRQINQSHLLVVILFENTEIHRFLATPPNPSQIPMRIMARKSLQEKKQVAQLLSSHGIQYLLTTPESLSMHTVNKYLELKARGLI